MGRERKDPIENQKPRNNPGMDVGGMLPFLPHLQDEDRVIYLASDINEYSISNVIGQLFSLSKRDSKKPIYLVISSFGGDIYSMFALYDAMKFVKCPIHVSGFGKIMSAAVLILAAGHKGDRTIGANCRVMIHSISGVNMGNVFEQQNSIKEMKQLQKLMERRLSEETGQDTKTIRKIMRKGRDRHLTAKQAKKLGIVDKIIGE